MKRIKLYMARLAKFLAAKTNQLEVEAESDFGDHISKGGVYPLVVEYNREVRGWEYKAINEEGGRSTLHFKNKVVWRDKTKSE